MVLSADSWDDSQGMTRAETPGVGLFHVINQNSVSWSQQKMCKYKSLTKVHIIHWSSCQLASQCIGQVKITRDRECDMWHVQHVTPPHGPTCISPKHNWETEFLTLPRQAIFNTWSQGADGDTVLPNICNNDGEVKMRNCNPALLHFKCIPTQQNIISSAMCNVFKKKYLVLWSPQCLVTPSQVRPRPHRY